MLFFFFFDLFIHQRILDKCVMVSTKILGTVFNIDHDKCFLSSKSAY